MKPNRKKLQSLKLNTLYELRKKGGEFGLQAELTYWKIKFKQMEGRYKKLLQNYNELKLNLRSV